MKTRRFGKTGWPVSEIGFGAWAIGADWGEVSERDAEATLEAALDRGVTLIDTADVYGDGRSEKIIARVLKARGGDVRVLTKAGRRLKPHVAEGYNTENLTRFVERSLANLGLDTIDLVQLHCPPRQVYDGDVAFDALEALKAAGKIRHYGVSVEFAEDAIKAAQRPGIASVQVIFNMFRQKPAERFFAIAKERDVAILARVPLASGLLTGKMSRATAFDASDHRSYNRHGEAFDVGETFSGVPFEVGLDAVEQLRPLVPGGATMAQWALRWILMFDAVSCVIPGAKSPAQAESNAAASGIPALSESNMAAVRDVYDRMIRPHVHASW